MISKNYSYLAFFIALLISFGIVIDNASANQTSQTITSTVTIVKSTSLSIAPASGPGDTEVIVTGTNFAPNTNIKITFVDAYGSFNELGTVKTSASGSFAKSVDIPDDAYPGVAMISTLQDNKILAQTTFTVPFPEISLSPVSGPSGTTVTIEGSDFTLNEKIHLFIGPDITNHLIHIGEVKTDGVGSFTTKATIPDDLLAGNYFVSAREDINHKVYAAVPFTVTVSHTKH